MKFKLDTNPATEIATPCLVIGVFEKSALHGSAKLIDQASNGALQELIDSEDIGTGWKDTTMLHGLAGVAAKRILVVGCGEAEDFCAVRYDKICTSAGEFLREHTTTSAHICLHEIITDKMENELSATTEGPGLSNPAWRLRQAALNLSRANYRYTATKASKDDDKQPLASASFNADDNMQAVLDQASGLAKGYLRSTELGNLPPNICNPAYLVEQAREIAAGYENVSVEVLDEDEMTRLKMFAMLAVGRGSVNGSKLIILKFQGAAEEQRPVVLVGKGITFDSGGLSLKPGPNMEQMKFDMGGAASVFGAF